MTIHAHIYGVGSRASIQRRVMRSSGEAQVALDGLLRFSFSCEHLTGTFDSNDLRQQGRSKGNQSLLTVRNTFSEI